MRLWGRSRRVVAGDRLTPDGYDGRPPSAATYFGAAELGDAWVPAVTRDEAMAVPAVKRGRNLLCTTIASFPLLARSGAGRKLDPQPVLLRQPDPAVTRAWILSATVDDLIFYGMSFWLVTGRDWRGYPAQVEHLIRGRVSWDTDLNDRPIPPLRVDGRQVPDRDIIRFDALDRGILRDGAEVIGTALSQMRAARRNAKTPVPSGGLKNTGANLPADQVDQLLTDWDTARNTNSTAYLNAALEYQTYSHSAKDAQLLEGRQYDAAEIARLINLPPWYVGADAGNTQTYSNLTTQRRDLIDLSLRAYIAPIEERLSLGDVTPRGVTVTCDLDDFLRGNPSERFAIYDIGLRTGIFTVPEVRREEDLVDMPPIDSAPAEAPADQGAAAAHPAAFRAVTASDRPITVDAGAAGNHPTTDSDVRRVDAVFAGVRTVTADQAGRRISGVALPYGAIGATSLGPLRFEAGAFADQLAEGAQESRVLLQLDHDSRQLVGRMIDAQDSAESLRATFAVSATRAGDEALVLAADGVRDGLSVGADILTSHIGQDGVETVTSAVLREISLVGHPAYSGAGVDSVAASQGATMDDDDQTTTTTTTTATATDPATDPATGAPAATAASVVAADPGPLVVPAVPRVHVTAEAEPYTEASAARGLSWVRDVVCASSDPEALARLRQLDAAAGGAPQVTAAGPYPNWRFPSYLQTRVVQPYIAQPVLLQLLASLPLTAASLIIPMLTSKPPMAKQASDGADLPQAGPTTDTAEAKADTYGGEVLLRQQDIDFASPALDTIVSAQIARQFRATIDGILWTAVAAGAGAKPEAATWDYAGLRAAVEHAKTTVYATGMPADAIVMSAATWEILVMTDDANDRPMLPYAAPMNVSGAPSASERTREGMMGTWCGLPVYVDSACPDTEVLVADTTAGYVALMGPRVRTLSERESRGLNVVVQGYGYVAATVAHSAASYVVITKATPPPAGK